MATAIIDTIPAPAPPRELEQKALSLPEQAQALTIRDQATYDLAAEAMKGYAALEREIKDHYKPLKDAAFQAHRAVCGAETKMLEPVSRALQIAKAKVAEYQIEQERIRRDEEARMRAEAERRRMEEQRRLEAEAAAAAERARKAAEEQKLADAVQAEAEGASSEEIQSILEAEVPAPVFAAPIAPPMVAPVVAPRVQQAAGVSKPRDNWSAEVTNPLALAKFVVDNPTFANLVQPNMVALNQLAKAQKNLLSIPGVRALNNPTISVRRY